MVHRYNANNAGRSSTWIGRTISIAEDGATWIKERKDWPQQRKKPLLWPSSRAGVSSLQSNVRPFNQKVAKKHSKKARHTKDPSLRRSATEDVVFEKQHGREISSGNVSWWYMFVCCLHRFLFLLFFVHVVLNIIRVFEIPVYN